MAPHVGVSVHPERILARKEKKVVTAGLEPFLAYRDPGVNCSLMKVLTTQASGQLFSNEGSNHPGL